MKSLLGDEKRFRIYIEYEDVHNEFTLWTTKVSMDIKRVRALSERYAPY